MGSSVSSEILGLLAGGVDFSPRGGLAEVLPSVGSASETKGGEGVDFGLFTGGVASDGAGGAGETDGETRGRGGSDEGKEVGVEVDDGVGMDDGEVGGGTEGFEAEMRDLVTCSLSFMMFSLAVENSFIMSSTWESGLGEGRFLGEGESRIVMTGGEAEGDRREGRTMGVGGGPRLCGGTNSSSSSRSSSSSSSSSSLSLSFFF